MDGKRAHLPDSLIIAYDDPYGVWPEVGLNLESMMPIKICTSKGFDKGKKVKDEAQKSSSGYEGLVYCKFIKRDAIDMKNATNYLSELPYMSLYVIPPVHPDVYKSVVKADLKSWLSSRENKEWMVIYGLCKRDSEVEQELNAKTIDKLRTRVHTLGHKHMRLGLAPILSVGFIESSNRLKELLKSGPSENPPLTSIYKDWTDIREGIRYYLSNALSSRYNHIISTINKYNESQVKNTLNAYFLGTFRLKENLLYFYLKCGLYEEVVSGYSSTHYQNGSKMSNDLYKSLFTGVYDLDDFSHIPLVFNPNYKYYRSSIINSNITYLEFRKYILSKQLIVLDSVNTIASLFQICTLSLEFVFDIYTELLSINCFNGYRWLYLIIKEIVTYLENKLVTVSSEVAISEFYYNRPSFPEIKKERKYLNISKIKEKLRNYMDKHPSTHVSVPLEKIELGLNMLSLNCLHKVKKCHRAIAFLYTLLYKLILNCRRAIPDDEGDISHSSDSSPSFPKVIGGNDVLEFRCDLKDQGGKGVLGRRRSFKKKDKEELLQDKPLPSIQPSFNSYTWDYTLTFGSVDEQCVTEQSNILSQSLEHNKELTTGLFGDSLLKETVKMAIEHFSMGDLYRYSSVMGTLIKDPDSIEYIKKDTHHMNWQYLWSIATKNRENVTLNTYPGRGAAAPAHISPIYNGAICREDGKGDTGFQGNSDTISGSASEVKEDDECNLNQSGSSFSRDSCMKRIAFNMIYTWFDIVLPNMTINDGMDRLEFILIKRFEAMEPNSELMLLRSSPIESDIVHCYLRLYRLAKMHLYDEKRHLSIPSGQFIKGELGVMRFKVNIYSLLDLMGCTLKIRLLNDQEWVDNEGKASFVILEIVKRGINVVKGINKIEINHRFTKNNKYSLYSFNLENESQYYTQHYCQPIPINLIADVARNLNYKLDAIHTLTSIIFPTTFIINRKEDVTATITHCTHGEDTSDKTRSDKDILPHSEEPSLTKSESIASRGSAASAGNFRKATSQGGIEQVNVGDFSRRERMGPGQSPFLIFPGCKNYVHLSLTFGAEVESVESVELEKCGLRFSEFRVVQLDGKSIDIECPVVEDERKYKLQSLNFKVRCTICSCLEVFKLERNIEQKLNLRYTLTQGPEVHTQILNFNSTEPFQAHIDTNDEGIRSAYLKVVSNQLVKIKGVHVENSLEDDVLLSHDMVYRISLPSVDIPSLRVKYCFYRRNLRLGLDNHMELLSDDLWYELSLPRLERKPLEITFNNPPIAYVNVPFNFEITLQSRESISFGYRLEAQENWVVEGLVNEPYLHLNPGESKKLQFRLIGLEEGLHMLPFPSLVNAEASVPHKRIIVQTRKNSQT